MYFYGVWIVEEWDSEWAEKEECAPWTLEKKVTSKELVLLY